MTVESAADPNAMSPEMLRSMAAVVGVILTPERTATLAPQAGQHFAQLTILGAIASSSTEPAAEFRLDRWSAPGSD